MTPPRRCISAAYWISATAPSYLKKIEHFYSLFSQARAKTTGVSVELSWENAWSLQFSFSCFHSLGGIWRLHSRACLVHNLWMLKLRPFACFVFFCFQFDQNFQWAATQRLLRLIVGVAPTPIKARGWLSSVQDKCVGVLGNC